MVTVLLQVSDGIFSEEMAKRGYSVIAEVISLTNNQSENKLEILTIFLS